MADIQEYSVSIKFKTEGSEKASKDANNVKDSISKLKSASAGFDGLKSGLGKLTNFTGKVAKGVKVAAVATGAALVKAGKTASKYSKEMMDYIETVNLFGASMGDLSNEAMKLVNRGEIELGLNPQSMMNAIASFQNLSEGFGIASDRAFIMSKNLAQLSGDLSSFANISYETAQKKLMSGFSGQVMPLRQYGIALDQASLQELAYSLGIEQKVKTMTRAQKTELIYYQIMKSTQKMQGDLGRTLMSPANALRVMQNEFKALARAVGSIFIPIMQRIIPIMRMVTKALTQAAQAIAKFFGFDIENYTADLGGVGSGLEGIADDVDDVGGAAEGTAKKLNKMLMPFDELNNMNSSDSSGSGGGAGSGGIGGGSLGIDLPQYDMFANINDQVETFGDILGKASEGAHKLNEALAGIDWETIKEGASTAGKNLAEFLNVGIHEIDWNTMGKTFAEGLNTIMETAYGFVTTFDWSGLGNSLSDSINGFVENFDAIKWAETVGTSIKGALETIYTTIENTDWFKLGEKVKDYITNIDWNGIVDGIFRGLGAAIAGIGQFLAGLLGEGLQKAFEFFQRHTEEQGGNVALGILYGIQEVFMNIGQWIYDHIFKPFIDGFKNTFGIHSPSTVMAEQGEYIMEGLKNGIEGFIDKIKEIWDKVKETVLEKIEDIKTGITEIFQKIWGAILRGAQTAVNKVIDGLNKIIQGINEVGGYLGLHLEEISHVTWADEYDKQMEEAKKKTEETMGDIKDITSQEIEETSKNVETNATKIEGNISEKFGKGKNSAVGSLMELKSEAEKKFSEVSNSKELAEVKNKIQWALDNSQKARELGEATSSGFQNGIFANLGPDRIGNFVSSNVRGAFDLKNSAYYWGSDMVEGYKNGIESKKGVLARVSETLAGVVSKYLHFSRPDEGPLRDYETWMPDMIKGLSDSLIKAAPILDNTIEMISNRLADSLSNIELPDIENSLLVNQNATQLIGNIGNKTNAATKDNATTNMIRATYEAVSRALADNTGNNDNRQIIVNVGNKELYRGYGKYQDEQSNMLGVSI